MTRTSAVVVLLLTAAAGTAAAQQWSYEGSLSATTGKYFFTERTTSWVLTNGVAFRSGRLTLRASLPLWYQNTTLITSSGAGTIPTGGPEGQGAVSDSGEARRQRGGGGTGNGPGSAMLALSEPAVPAPEAALTGYELRMADPIASATVRLVEGYRVSFWAGASLKFPLADTATIGTGEWDIGGNASLSVRLGSRWTVGLDGAYWHLGDLDSLDLKDPLTGSLSIGTLFGDSWGAIVGVSAGTRYLTGFDPPVMILGSLSRLGGSGSWGFNFGAGLTETAPDFTLGGIWSVRFGW